MGLQKAGALLLLLIGAATSQFLGLMSDGCAEKGIGYNGQQIGTPQPAETYDKCRDKCRNEGSCKYWTWKKKPSKVCTLFQRKDQTVEMEDALGLDDSFTLDDIISGPKVCKGNCNCY